MSPAFIAENTVNIIDIRPNTSGLSSLASTIYDSLDPPDGSKERSLPTVLLYDIRGLQLFEEITYLDEYYLTNAEIEVLTAHARTIAERMPDSAQLIELGSGCVCIFFFSETPLPN